MNVNKSNKKLIGVPHVPNKILKNNENYDHHIVNINTMYIDENINSEFNTESEHLLKEKNYLLIITNK